MTACTRFAPMIGARAGELSSEDGRALADHLAQCEACQGRLADEAALSGMLSEALLDEANRRDFSRFSDEVLERIPAYRPARGTGLMGWVRRHRAAAMVSALAPAALAVALVVYSGRGPKPEEHAALLEVSAEGRGAIVLETSDGPVVLLGESEPEGT